MNPRLKELYQSVILKHSKEPVSYEKREEAAQHLDAYNSLCGDRFQLYFELEDGKIKDLSFHGYGCAISKASTSVLVKFMEGTEINIGDDVTVHHEKRFLSEFGWKNA